MANTIQEGGGSSTYLLPEGTVLHGRYTISKYLDQGGFGITYRGHDSVLDIDVAIKEYYPSGIVGRYVTDSTNVFTIGEETKSEFEDGKSQFIREARTLAKFDGDPAVVGVKDCFEENNTVYIIMEYLKGHNLKDHLDQNGPMSMSQAFALLRPVMVSLERVHSAGLIHRDISPSNLFLTDNGSVKLIDFGTARQYSLDSDKSFSIYLKPSYSPEEQYFRHSAQGPWTDVYALSASIYKLITGKTPENSLNRLSQDMLPAPSRLGADISPEQEAVLLKGMAVRRENRYQSMKELRAAFDQTSSPVSKYSSSQDDDDRTIAGPRGKASAVPQQTPAGQPPYHAAGSQQPASSQPYQTAGSQQPANSQPYQTAGSQQPADQPPLSRGEDPAGRVRQGASSSQGSSDQRYNANYNTSSDANPKKRSKLPLIAVFIVVVLLLGGAVYYLTRGGGSGGGVISSTGVLKDVDFYEKYGGTESATSYNLTITPEIIEALDNRKKVDEINFYNCIFEDGSVDRLGKIDRLIKLKFVNCTGISSFDPISGISALEEFYLGGDESVPLHLSKGELLSKEIAPVKQMTIRDVVFENDFSFLELFPGLETLYIYDSSTDSSGSKFAAGVSLKLLEINDSQMESVDFSTMSGSASVKYLTIRNCGITNVSFLHDMSALEEVDVSNNAITSLEGISNNPALRNFYASHNQIEDITPLEHCSALYRLDLDDNVVKDLSPLEHCGALGNISVNNNYISDLTPLTWLGALVSFTASDNQIAEIPDLSSCQMLQTFNISNNSVSDLSSIAGCSKLERLCFNDNNIYDLECLSGLLYLTELRGSGNRIGSLKGLENATQLKVVTLDGNQLTDFSVLKTASANINVLFIDDNQLTDLSPVSDFSALKGLSFGSNRISDLSPLENLPGLIYLCAADNEISDVTPIAKCGSLEFLDLSDNEISDISPLVNVGASSIALLLHNNKITDLLPLDTGKKYKYLTVYGNSIPDLSRIAELKNIDITADLYASWHEDADMTVLVDSGFWDIFLVDVPLDKRVEIEKAFSARFKSKPTFLSAEEADAQIAEKRVELMDSVDIY